TYQDNVHLPASVKQEIESRSQTDWFKAMGLGEWGAEGDVVLYNYEIVNEPKIKHFLGIGLDIGYTISPSAAVLLGKTTDDKIYAKELFKGCYTINEILDKLSEYRKKYHVIVDAAEKDIIETLRRLGYSAWESKKPSLKASYEKINMRKLAIDASSIELIREIRNLTWKDKIKGVTAGEDHLIDAMRYAYHSFVE
ncbi:MAG: hypothetical protein N3D75_04730, partial [Candidatus Aenigmarchaeota archaeon]|nr:hypothetical protein [Candidatus Aenigmarchaeota archaeon]